MDKPLFNLATLPEADEFLDSLAPAVVRKVAGGVKDLELFKKISENIWEFCTLYQGMAYRLFAFWDKDGETLVIATHGLVKKSQKTPKKEIDKAERIRTEYFASK